MKIASLGLGLLAAFSAALAFGQTTWNVLGWRSPAWIESNVVAEMSDFRTEYKCDKLRAEIRRLNFLPDSLEVRLEISRLEAIYLRLDCVKYEVF
jgi:hypothetical protein